MDLGFLDEQDRRSVVRLLAVSGNSQLVGEETHSKTLLSLDAKEFQESCRHLSEQHTAVAAQGRSEEELLSCLFVAAKEPNEGVRSP